MADLITITVDHQGVRDLLAGLRARLADLTPALETIGQVVSASARRNFREGGRPARWKMSRRAIEESGQTLLDTGRLRGSITSRVAADRVTVGTNVKYAAVHQFGFKGTVNVPAHRRMVKARDVRPGKKKKASGVAFVRAHARRMTVEARPFLLVQEEDWANIKRILARHLAGKK